MQVLKDPASYQHPSPLHLAIGMFDGVHIGHQAVIQSAIRSARIKDEMAGVLTFTPHPSQILRPSSPTLLIQSEEQKEERLASQGLDLLIWQSFSLELASVKAAEFIHRLKTRFPRLASIHVGENFRFGKGRNGDIETMLEAARELGIHVISIERVRYDGEAVSSTRIRKLLEEGRMGEVNELLGYPYYSTGTVEHGRQLGRTIGFPTLNIRWEPPCKPRLGVYEVRVGSIKGDATSLPAVVNYGLRPTVENAAPFPLLEIHILGECPFDAGDELRVEWLRFVRPEMKFDNLNALKAQIEQDKRQLLTVR